MSMFVSDDIVTACKSFITNVTVEPLDATVDMFVSVKSADIRECPRTHITDKGSLTAVYTFVSHQNTCSCECFIANVTTKPSVTSMAIFALGKFAGILRSRMSHVRFTLFIRSACIIRSGIAVHLFTCVTRVFSIILVSII